MIFTDRNCCYCSISITIWFNLWSSHNQVHDGGGGGDHYHFLDIIFIWGGAKSFINK
jgi:hypothetical protein